MKKTKKPIKVFADPDKDVEDFSSTEFDLRNKSDCSLLIHTETGGSTKSYDPNDGNMFDPDTEDELELERCEIDPTYSMY